MRHGTNACSRCARCFRGLRRENMASFGAIDNTSALPKYVQLRNILEAAIHNEHYASGEKLCTESELKKRFGCSTATVTKALSELERSGMVIRRKGAGTFVADKHGGDTSEPLRFGQRTLLLCGLPAIVMRGCGCLKMCRRWVLTMFPAPIGSTRL